MLDNFQNFLDTSILLPYFESVKFKEEKKLAVNLISELTLIVVSILMKNDPLQL
jgi:hypothetical protein